MFFAKSACPMRWQDLDGDRNRRFCDRCEKDTNLSALTRDDATQWVRANPGACVRSQFGPQSRVRSELIGLESGRSLDLFIRRYIETAASIGTQLRFDPLVGAPTPEQRARGERELGCHSKELFRQSFEQVRP